MRYKKSVFRSLAMVTQLGLCVLTPTILGIWAGSYVDGRYGTKAVLVFLVLGVLGGCRGAYMMAKRLIEIDAREEKAEQERRLQEAAAQAETSVSRPKVPSRIHVSGAEESDTARGGTSEAPREEDSS